jgi:hypothetical protein
MSHIEGDLLSMTNEQMDKSIGKFIHEVRKHCSGEYRGNTLYEIVVAIQHVMRERGRRVSFLDGKDPTFSDMREKLDSKMKSLARKGIGIEKRSADVITELQEYILWEKGVLGSDRPQQLLDTMLYLFGLHFALHAGKEHRNLRLGQYSQISLHTAESGPEYLIYTEDTSKTNQGGLTHRKIARKVTQAYANALQPERCPVQLYRKYINLRQVIKLLYCQTRKQKNVWKM